MDSNSLYPFDWNNQKSAYNGLVHDPLGEPSPVISGSSAFSASYQNPFRAGTANVPQPSDISMEGIEMEQPPAPSTASAQPETGSSRRAKFEQLDWNAHKASIKNLYLDENKSLPETMKVMNDIHSFKASQKLYKTMFKEWNWQKNLSTETALVMEEKAKQRKREEGKDTIFFYGGRPCESKRIESTLARAKKPRSSEHVVGVSYKTPKALVDSPPAENDAEGADVERIEISDDDFGDGLNDSIDVTPLDGSMLALTWQGHSRADLQDLWRTAIDCRNAGKFDEAENMFHRVFLGMGHVLGRTNEDTVKVAYNLADLYADSDRMGQAIDMIEKVVQNHITTYGCEDSKTQQNILHAVELLNGWNRQADALGLLSLSRELLESSSTARNSWRADIQTNGKGKIARAGSQANGKGKTVQWSTPHGSQSDLSGVVQSVLEDSSPARIDFGLGVARTHIAVKDQATEGLLQAIISQCEGRPNLSVQHLKALAEILNLYNKLDLADENEAAFEGALESLERVWSAYEWEEDTIESLDFMEAKLQVVANVLKHGYQTQAKYLFREATDKATDVFGWDDERTVWVLITIGLVYQTHMTWADGEEFFEQAFSAALSNKDWGPKDGIVRSLQNAMDNHHFSYVSNEGRPFKSIFGVSGIKIMPGRLHLE